MVCRFFIYGRIMAHHCYCCSTNRRAISVSSKDRVTSKWMPSSLSKDATRSTAPQQAVQVNSFEAALAKKGIVMKAALDKSPRKEQYFADLTALVAR